MKLVTTCPTCKIEIDVSNRYTGEIILCPSCETPIRVEFKATILIIGVLPDDTAE